MSTDRKSGQKQARPKPLRLSLAAARLHFSPVLDRVARGQWVLVTRRGQDVAVMVSVQDLLKLAPDAVEFLEDAEEII